MDTNLFRFGRHLAGLRKKYNWAQDKLALESGLARSYLSGVERGKRNISLRNICILADTLGLPPHELLAFDSSNGVAADTGASTPSDPYPSLNRAMQKLSERDQAWMADLVRTLSLRLGHGASKDE
ncbi:helix-turn-helix domain-containing protein [Pandoraea nosoerga]|uniref:Transcriptional regulator n=1 Tax=Pandoraea nosoerga TaxID=2508296 RepID=A0A5E4RY75_9BURK|nr:MULTISPECIES: helix-turn-helix domain-containing protein [Pandoraea]MBN4667656.1 helix-turn-helix domain-containing protein [Pandoraea nosoerga]MBN4674265.1 helix-turn-helix domain-containing protein [Pandoraea nosoerga]MBN4679534.1 helix-turn-helix domain-containing protein [Pandoraea nosoerga]MBN4743377.1 helix-turn-helix domain-containing protein [Pandoraea nosoerga]VVD67873.1 transcriptional regulator [Pandoraea nosoerga]